MVSIFACVMLTAPNAHGQSSAEPSALEQRASDATHDAVLLLTEWLGPPPAGTITAVTPARWLVPERDRSIERDAITGVARHFWLRHAAPTPFEQALVLHTSVHAIHHLLAGRHFETVRLFGGAIAYPIRFVLLSPPIDDPRPRLWHFDAPPVDAEVLRHVLALHTLERYVGWPTMTQALGLMRVTDAGPYDVTALGRALSTVRGTPMTRLVEECFRSGAIFDYAIDVRESTTPNGLRETSLTVDRRGSGVFAVDGDDDPEPSLPVLVRFDDGTDIREWVNGAAPSTTLVYTSKTAVVYAAVDPEAMLVLDVNRANNTFATASPIRRLGIRLAVHWMSWLQQTMLAYTALV
jgi:hypothetical protein